MKIGTDPVWMRRLGATVTTVAVVVVMGLVLVAPVDGPFTAREHEFTMVHPIFPHHLSPHSAGAHADADEHAAAESGAFDASMPFVALAAPSPADAGLAVVSEGMLLPVALMLADLALLWALLARQRHLGDQIRLAVPTGPPRPRSFV